MVGEGDEIKSKQTSKRDRTLLISFFYLYSATVGSVTSQPHNCSFCHKQYATNAKLLQHQRKEHQGDHNYNQKRGQMSPMGAPAASGASRDPLDIETGQVSGRLVTISGKYRFYFSSSCSKKIWLNNSFLIVIVGTCTESISIKYKY